MLYSFRRIFAARRRKARIYMKLFGKIIKAVLTVLVFAVIGAFIFRIIIANAEYVLDEITPTENAMNAYEKLGEDAFMTNRIDDTISGKEDGADGYYSAFSFIYIPEYSEVQVTARVNDSTLDRLGLEKLPHFFLRNYATGETWDCVFSEDEHSLMYGYRRMVFEGINITEDSDILLCMSSDGSDVPESELVIHFREQKLKAYKLSGAEKKSLREGIKLEQD